MSSNLKTLDYKIKLIKIITSVLLFFIAILAYTSLPIK